MGGEANVPHTGGETDENQSGSLHLSRLANDQLVKLAGTSDPKAIAQLIVSLKANADANADAAKQLVELRRGIETAHREQIITSYKAKLSPRLIALARRMPVKDMKEFCEALPAQVELHEPQPTGANRMVTLTREDKEVARLSGKTEKEFADMKEAIGDERLIALAGNVGPKPDKAPQTNWDRKYAEHFMSLSMTDMTPDCKPWKPATGSVFLTAATRR
jgi:hypothetical protein